MVENTGEPLISIIVPVYNTEKYLKDCIDSVISQSFDNWELILVDDGSKDNSYNICSEYAKKDERIKVFHKDNSGQYDTRLMGIRHATGQYITALDSDDYIESDYLRKIADYIEASDCDVLEWVIRFVYPDKITYSSNVIAEGEYECLPFMKQLIAKSDHSLCNKAIRKSYFDGKQFDNAPKGIKMSEDYMMLAMAVMQSEKIKVVKDIFYNYRRNDASISHVVTGKIILDLYMVSDYLMKQYKEQGIADEELINAEYKGLLAGSAKRVKQAFEDKAFSKEEYKMIKSCDSYKDSRKYEIKENLTSEGMLTMKLFRFWGYGICSFVYGVLYGLKNRK